MPDNIENEEIFEEPESGEIHEIPESERIEAVYRDGASVLEGGA